VLLGRRREAVTKAPGRRYRTVLLGRRREAEAEAEGRRCETRRNMLAVMVELIECWRMKGWGRDDGGVTSTK